MKRTPFALLLVFLAIIPLHFASPETLPSTKCHEQERSALLEFKQFLFRAASEICLFSGHSSKLESWKLEDGDCCSWEGVECDEGMGYVTGLDLSQSCLWGSINSNAGLFRLIHLQSLNLALNDFNNSQIPSSIGDLVELASLDLSRSSFGGQIPSQLLELTNLSSLDLSGNSRLELRNPSVEIVVQSLTKLGHLDLSWLNAPALILDAVANLSSLTSLVLRFCNLPGTLPTTIFELPRLQLLNLEDNPQLNLIASFTAIKWSNLMTLDLRYNDIQGLLPTPPKVIKGYLVSNNQLSGEISLEMCQLSSISMLDLSKSKLTSIIPPCLSNLSETLSTLSLHGNDLYGRFPVLQNDVCTFNMIDVRHNRLQGSLPRGLVNCSRLEFLNFRNNQIIDTFPSLMGSLSDLKELILSSNRFHGAIGEPEAPDQFPNLRTVDLSLNNFSSSLPFEYFGIWRSMKVHYAYDACYYENYVPSYLPLPQNGGEYDFPMTIMNKGIAMEYEKISGYLTAIDLSSNNFIGEIPNSVGSLTELHMLNLSNNALTGSIPTIKQVNFLAFFNVSNNHLSGPIPRANQFTTFDNDSYGGNLGLCGVSLTQKCRNPVEAPPAPPSGALAKEDPGTWFEELDWKIVLVGFGSGLVIGVVMGHNTTPRVQHWFVKKLFGQRQRTRATKGEGKMLQQHDIPH
ncbi:receptor-like protein 43 [Rhodamnia argentea]|uniref:Receptor-like protein 43 n=1 Tax=Rhodamnia argentea TaxID=178133 RepID=A0A8B8NUZ2_9MYRT|nr:receptor-like protein 43 [Rhodamnia argentea]